jgi:hypothetical protein
MSASNLYLQSEWLAAKQILCYTVFTVNKAMMAYWGEQVIQALREKSDSDTIRLLFDLSHPNVSMSYFVLTNRKLLNVGITEQGQQQFMDILAKNPQCEFKLAVLLSNTMLGALGKHTPEKYQQSNFLGKIFFNAAGAEQWLIAEKSGDDVKTGIIPTQDLDEALIVLAEYDLDIYGNRGQLRLLIMGSVEVVSISEDTPVTIGRGEQVDLNLRSYGHIARSVSRIHAQITLTDGRLSIIDLNSRNGTMLSGRQLEANKPAFIRRDDVIKVGLLEISVVF